jgi:uncharacterized protein YjbJ (UPF0337 family)
MGIGEELKGSAKEAVGEATGNESMRDEGQAQQDKADAEQTAARKEREADQARTEALDNEAEQRSRQG